MKIKIIAMSFGTQLMHENNALRTIGTWYMLFTVMLSTRLAVGAQRRDL